MATREQFKLLAPEFMWYEFKYPDKLYWPFLVWLHQVRVKAGVPMEPTSDFRVGVPVGGSDTSLHLVGRAVDFRWWKHTPEQRARIIEAVVTTPRPLNEGGYELGLEPTAKNGPHWHIGLFSAARPEPKVFVK